MELLGVILLVVSGVSFTCATVMLCRANPKTALAWFFGRPLRSPWQANAAFGLAGGTGVLGVIQLFDTLEYWAILVLIGMWGVSLPIQYRHNRGVARDQPVRFD